MFDEPCAAGTSYDVEDWVPFLAGIVGPIPEDHPVAELVREFTDHVCSNVDEVDDTLITDREDEHRFAFRAYGSIVGLGVGLWDEELCSREVGEEIVQTFGPTVTGLAHRIEEEIFDLDPEFREQLDDASD